MTNDMEIKEIEKPMSVIKNEEITNKQLFEKLARVEDLLVKIDRKLNKPLIG